MPRRVKSTDTPELSKAKKQQQKRQEEEAEAKRKAAASSDSDQELSDVESVDNEDSAEQKHIDAALMEDHSFMMRVDEAGNLKRGTVAVLKDKVCKVVENHVSKTGKHGHAKCAIVGIELFSGKKVQEAMPSSGAVKVVNVEKTEYELVSIPTVDRHLEDVPGESHEALVRPIAKQAPQVPPKPMAVAIADVAWDEIVSAYNDSKHEKKGFALTVTITKAPKIKNEETVLGVRFVTGFRKGAAVV